MEKDSEKLLDRDACQVNGGAESAQGGEVRNCIVCPICSQVIAWYNYSSHMVNVHGVDHWGDFTSST